MALKIGISSYVSAGYTDPVIWRLYEAGSSVLVDSHQEMGPHGTMYNFDFTNNIKDVVYTVKFYNQPGGIGVGTLEKSHDVTVSTQTLTFDADIELIVDGGESYDPVSTESSVIIPDLLGKDFYIVQRGIGQLLQDRNIEVIPDLVNGGFSLTGGNTFNPDDIFIAKIRPSYVVNAPGSSSGSSIYKELLVITGDIVLAGTDFGKKIIVDGATAVVTIQLPAIASIIENVSLWIESVGTTHKYVVIKAALGELITATASTSNTFIIGRATQAEVLLKTGILYGFTDDVDIKKRGQIEWGYYVGLNRLWADGTEYLTADYPGLKKAMDAMPAGRVISYALWNSSVFLGTRYPYKGMFALSVDGLHFKVPDYRNRFIRALRYSDATADGERLAQGAGGYQKDEFKSHDHDFPGSVQPGGGGDSSRRGVIDNTLRTGLAGGAETRGENIGLIPQVIL